MYERILVPTDGSDPATAAARHARELGDRFDAEIRLLSVVAEGRGRVGTGDGGDRRRAQHALDEASRHWADVDYDPVSVLEVGSPPRTIVDHVREHDVDLVVMGTHGRTGLRRYLVGSVAEAVVRTAPVPVLVVGADGEERSAEVATETQTVGDDETETTGGDTTYAIRYTDPGVDEGVGEDVGSGRV